MGGPPLCGPFVFGILAPWALVCVNYGATDMGSKWFVAMMTKAV